MPVVFEIVVKKAELGEIALFLAPHLAHQPGQRGA
jgi:hypothetical protein